VKERSGATVEQRVQLKQRSHRILEPNPALVRQAEMRAKSIENRIADRITEFAGSMPFVYIHIAWFGCWIALGVEPRQILDLTKAIHADSTPRSAA
jgi:uncharacterized membrane protein